MLIVANILFQQLDVTQNIVLILALTILKKLVEKLVLRIFIKKNKILTQSPKNILQQGILFLKGLLGVTKMILKN